jgi:cytochrome c-type biogenesis protein CcmH
MTKRRVLPRIALGFVSATLSLLISPVDAQQTDRAKQIGGKLLCGVGTPICQCNQILTQCNHVGCQNSTAMLKTLDKRVAKGEPEETILQGFVQEFGTAVLSEPPKTGFSLVAWIMPFFYLIGGAILVVFVISRWSKRPQQRLATPNHAPAVSAEYLERARAQSARETDD